MPKHIIEPITEEERDADLSDESMDFFKSIYTGETIILSKESEAFYKRFSEITQTREPVRRPKPGELEERSALFDIGKSIARDGIMGIAEGIFRFPDAIEGAFGYITEDDDFRVSVLSRPIANWIQRGRQSEALAPGPLTSLAQGTDFADIASDLRTGLWWTNKFPGMAMSAVAPLIPGLAGTKLARMKGLTKAAATSFGRSVSINILFLSEGGSSYESIRLDLIASGIPPHTARVAAGRGAIPSALIKSIVERGILPRQFKPDVKLFERIIRGGVGEIAEEELQLLIDGATRYVVREALETSLNLGLNPRAFVESGIAAGAGGGAFGSIQRGPTSAMLVNELVKHGVPAHLAEKMIADKIKATPGLAKETEPIAGLESTRLDQEPEPERFEEQVMADAAAKATQEQLDQAIEEITQALGNEQQKDQEELSNLKSFLKEEATKPDRPKKDKEGPSLLENLGIVKTRGRLVLSKAGAINQSIKDNEAKAEAGRRKINKRKVQEEMAGIKKHLSKNEIELAKQKIAKLAKAHLSKVEQEKLIASLSKPGSKLTTRQLGGALRKIESAIKKIETQTQRDRLTKLINETNIKSIGRELRPAIKAIVNAFTTRSVRANETKAMRALLKRMQTHPEERLPNWKIEELDILNKTSVSQLTAVEAEILADQFEHLLREHEKARRIQYDKAQHSFDKTTALILEELDRPDSPTKKRLTGPDGKLKEIDKSDTAKLFSIFIEREGLMTTDTLAEFLFGSDSSTGYQWLHKNVVAGNVKAIGRAQKNNDSLIGMLQELGIRSKDDIKAWSDDILEITTEVGIARDKDDKITIKRNVQTIKATREEWTDVLASMGDTETADLILFDQTPVWIKSHNSKELVYLSRENIKDIENMVGEEAIELAQGIIKLMNGQEGIDYGNATFEIFGEDLRRDGIYYSRSRKEDIDPFGIGYKNFKQKMPQNAGINKERTNDPSIPIVIMGIFERFNNWNLAHSATIELAIPLREASRLLNHRDIKGAIRDGRGVKTIERFELMYDHIVRQFIGGEKGVKSPTFRKAIDNITTGFLALSPKTALFQVASALVAAVDMPTGAISRAITSGAMFNKDLDEEMSKADPWIRMRMGGAGTAVINESSGFTQSLKTQIEDKSLREKLMFMIEAMDRMALRTIWQAAKIQAEKEGHTGPGAEVRTVEIAQRVMMRTQPTFDPTSITGLGLKGRENDIVRTVIMFRGQTGKNVDMTLRAQMRVSRGQITYTEFARQMALIYGAQGLWITSIRAGWAMLLTAAVEMLTGDEAKEEDEKVKKFLFSYLDTIAGNYLGGDAVAFLGRKVFQQPAFEPELSPVVSILNQTYNSMGKGLSALTKGELKESFAKMIVAGGLTTAIITGIPTVEATKIMGKIIEKSGKKNRGDKRSSRRPSPQRRSSPRR